MKSIVFLSLLLMAFNSFADQDGAYLDADYGDFTPIQVEANKSFKSNGYRSDFLSMTNILTPVKAQASRGTCSIFSAVALLESMMVRDLNMVSSIDLSEEWVEFLAMSSSMSTTDGSNASTNLSLIQRYGVVSEKSLPYLTNTWKSVNESELTKERCGEVSGTRYEKTCLLGHWDPRLLNKTANSLVNSESESEREMAVLKQSAASNKANFLANYLRRASYYDYSVRSDSAIKSLLDRDIPLTMGIDFYYGAWNHGRAGTYGIGRNLENFNKGIIGVPVRGSVDSVESRKSDRQAGHSVLIVGYDDRKEVNLSIKMTDGTTKDFTFTGVYYIKNSWGTSGFGKDFEIDGVKYPGYGMIPYAYANTYGRFTRLPVNN